MNKYHRFFLLSAADYPTKDFGKLYREKGTVNVSDDLIRYMYDSLLWIPSVNPSINMVEQSGLNLYGETIIKKKGGIIARRIFESWCSLFDCGPDIVTLTGSYISNPEVSGNGQYEKIELQKSFIINDLSHFVSMCNDLDSSPDTKFILHLGI